MTSSVPSVRPSLLAPHLVGYLFDQADLRFFYRDIDLVTL
jgi:hypothetical protein